jgi:hypothetical protein
VATITAEQPLPIRVPKGGKGNGVSFQEPAAVIPPNTDLLSPESGDSVSVAAIAAADKTLTTTTAIAPPTDGAHVQQPLRSRQKRSGGDGDRATSDGVIDYLNGHHPKLVDEKSPETAHRSGSRCLRFARTTCRLFTSIVQLLLLSLLAIFGYYFATAAFNASV